MHFVDQSWGRRGLWGEVLENTSLPGFGFWGRGGSSARRFVPWVQGSRAGAHTAWPRQPQLPSRLTHPLRNPYPSSGRSIPHSLDHRREPGPLRDPARHWEPPQPLPCKTPGHDADTQRGCLENRECLTSTTGRGMNTAPWKHHRVFSSCCSRALANAELKPSLARPLRVALAIAAPSHRNHSVGQQHSQGKGWAGPCKALWQREEKLKSSTSELLRASPVPRALSADAVTTTDREESKRYTDFPPSQMLFGRPAVSPKHYESTKNPSRSRHSSKGEGRSEREEEGRLFTQTVM